MNPGYAGSGNSSESQSKKGHKRGKKSKEGVRGLTLEGAVTGGTAPFVTTVAANPSQHRFNISGGVDPKFTEQRKATCPTRQYDLLVDGEVGVKVYFQDRAGLRFTLTKN